MVACPFCRSPTRKRMNKQGDQPPNIIEIIPMLGEALWNDMTWLYRGGLCFINFLFNNYY